MKRTTKTRPTDWTKPIVCVFILLASCTWTKNDLGIARVSIDARGSTAGRAFILGFSGPMYMMDLAVSVDTAWISLPEGTWTIEARAVDSEGREISSGTVSNVRVRSGNTTPASIVLRDLVPDPIPVAAGIALAAMAH